MERYKVMVYEVRRVLVEYEVEAANLEEAKHCADMGDAVREEEAGEMRVLDRFPDWDTLVCIS